MNVLRFTIYIYIYIVCMSYIYIYVNIVPLRKATGSSKTLVVL